MKCQNCEKPATFHITDLTGDEIISLHLCPNCAKEHLHPGESSSTSAPTLANVLKQQLNITQTAEELAKLDKKTCPVCGISFYEFRQVGRLGCPHDYSVFAEELEPLLLNVHGNTQHIGKTPKRTPVDQQRQTELIRMRREMRDAIEAEDYEKASSLRDKIRHMERGETP
jgi:protein arginine kinase activator